MNVKKYRPYFTLAELKYLAELSFKHSQVSTITKYLQKQVCLIDAGFKASNYEATGRGVADKLSDALADPEEKEANVTTYSKTQQERYLANEMSPEEEK